MIEYLPALGVIIGAALGGGFACICLHRRCEAYLDDAETHRQIACAAIRQNHLLIRQNRELEEANVALMTALEREDTHMEDEGLSKFVTDPDWWKGGEA